MKVGPYEIQGELGRGGMGVVFRAKAPDGRVVAVKLLRSGSTERFARERRLLEELSEEDGFVPFLASGESREGPWIAMPLVQGGTLRAKLKEEVGLPIAEVERIGLALARALARAHARGIVHRDLKPENVLFTATGTPLVADLGLAKHFAPDARTLALSSGGELRGTIGYMAPEQALDSKVVDDKADVFSLGAILHELLCGTPAFVADGPIAVLARVESGTPDPISREDAPPYLVRAVAAALARDPRARPSAADLARVLEEKRVLDAPPRPRKRTLAPVFAVLGLVLLAGVAAFARPAPAPPSSRLAVVEAALARGDARAALEEARLSSSGEVSIVAKIHEVAAAASDWACERETWKLLEARGAPPRAAAAHLVATILQDPRRPSPLDLDDLARRPRSELESPPLLFACGAAYARAASVEHLERLLLEKALPVPLAERASVARRFLEHHARLAAKLPELDDLVDASRKGGPNVLPADRLAAFRAAARALGLARRADPALSPFPDEALRFLALARVAGNRLAARREYGHEPAWAEVFALDPEHPTHLFLRARIEANSVAQDGSTRTLTERVEAAVAALERSPRCAALELLAEDMLVDLGVFFSGEPRAGRIERLAALAGERADAREVASAALSVDSKRLAAVRDARKKRALELTELSPR